MLYCPTPLNELGFIREISKDDWMAKGKSPEGYYMRGYEALSMIFNECRRAKINPARILDFGCGHGNVARMLDAEFKASSVVGQDVDPSWLDWCSSVLGIEVVQSATVISDVQIAKGSYDLIWVGSVFTHIPQRAARHLLTELRNALTKTGLLIFTTAGKIVRDGFQVDNESFLDGVDARRAVREYDSNGYGFAPYQGGRYNDWGRTMVAFDWYINQARKLDMHLVGFQEGGWGQRQDIYSFTRG